MSSHLVSARQIVEDCDSKFPEVDVSLIEQNRLAVEGRRILNVVPPVKGALISSPDEETGDFYFTPAQAALGTITVFVTDDQQVTCRLKLKPRPIAGEDIVIRPVDKSLSKTTKADGRAASYQRRVKDLVITMADDELKDKGDVQKVNKEIPLWKEGRMVLMSLRRDGDLVGETYRLTNISGVDMLLAEQELYRRGVVAVSIEHHTLPANESTAIWIVRGRKENE